MQTILAPPHLVGEPESEHAVTVLRSTTPSRSGASGSETRETIYGPGSINLQLPCTRGHVREIGRYGALSVGTN
jgi:hypothetical protein